ncbi:MAG: histidine phosphatase family protein [Verrucomicrobia bacterium]|nr:histidine phosphatase family protein [Verrucomicrobiota bacterium]
MSHIFLVRHGQTIWHAENRYAGRSDVALDAEGYAQAERLARWAVGARLTAIWCSPLSRARLTATPAAHAIGLKLQIDDRLREIDFGLLDGKTIAEVEPLYAEAVRLYDVDPVANSFPGGEDPHQVAARAVSVLREIAAADPAGRVLIVAHNTLIRLTLCSLFAIPFGRYRKVFPAVDNVSLTEIRFKGPEAALLRYNAPIVVSCPT